MSPRLSANGAWKRIFQQPTANNTCLKGSKYILAEDEVERMEGLLLTDRSRLREDRRYSGTGFFRMLLKEVAETIDERDICSKVFQLTRH